MPVLMIFMPKSRNEPVDISGPWDHQRSSRASTALPPGRPLQRRIDRKPRQPLSSRAGSSGTSAARRDDDDMHIAFTDGVELLIRFEIDDGDAAIAAKRGADGGADPLATSPTRTGRWSSGNAAASVRR